MSRNSSISENKMGTHPVVPLLLSMALPPVASMFMQYTYNFVDVMYVSWISEEALTAVSLAFPLTTLVLAIAIGLGVGTNVIIARRLGRKDQAGANQVVTHSILLSAVVGALLTLATYLAADPFYALFTDNPEIHRLGLEYTHAIALMAFGVVMHICVQKVIQATGNMVAPMLFQMAGVILNFVLDPILIFGLLGFPALGVRGAAIATVSGYFLSALLGFYVLIFTPQKVAIATNSFKGDPRLFWEIWVVGFPSLVMNALGALMVVFANGFLAAYSMTAVAFFGIYYKIQHLIVMTVNGVVQGCMPVMGYNHGAGNRSRLMEAFRAGLVTAMVIMALGTLVLWVFPAFTLRLFRASDSMLAFGIPALRIMSASYVLAACGLMFASLFQATGCIRFSLLINLMRQLGLLVPFMWLLIRVMGMPGIWWAFPLAEVITTLACLWIFRVLAKDENNRDQQTVESGEKWVKAHE